MVRQADPDRWSQLRGDARKAVDLRLQGELLLGLHEDLHRARRAPALPRPEGRWRGEFDTRLRRQPGVDEVLTDYGLSPHPSLVLVVEVETEMRVMPQVMDLFKVRRDDDFIVLQNAASVDRDLTSLISYLAPRTEPDSDGRYLRLLRPLTRMLFVGDAEGRMATAELRNRKRDVWVDRLVRTFPTAQQTAALQDALKRLVYIEVWRRNGESFEFAHFTDRQIAAAVDRLDRRPNKPGLQRLVPIVAQLRRDGANLKSVLGSISKLDLADELWPVLERKMTLAKQRDTHMAIPIVRVLDRAIVLAHEVRRRGVVIPLAR